MSFKKQIELVHRISRSKGLWAGVVDKREVIMQIIAEISLAYVAKGEKNLALYELFYKDLAPLGFEDCFKKYLLNTFEDRIAQTCITVFDYAAKYSMRINNITEYYDREFFALKPGKDNVDKTKPEISSIGGYLFSIIRPMTNLHHSGFQSQQIGEILGKIFYMAQILNFDLNKQIEMKLKYEIITHNFNIEI